ncbi:MAG: hypothetical protein WBQ94_03515 [Terracidiphilus sp.]
MAQTGVLVLTPYTGGTATTSPQAHDNTQHRFITYASAAINPSTSQVITSSAWSITTNVITVTTATQSPALTSGETVRFTSPTINSGAYVDLVVSATGLTTTQFEAPYTATNASATEAGSLFLTPQYVTNGLPITWSQVTTTQYGNLGTQTQPIVAVFRSTTGGVFYSYKFDTVHNTLRIATGGTELSNAGNITADTIIAIGEWLRGE